MSRHHHRSSRATVLLIAHLLTGCTGASWRPVALPGPDVARVDSLPARPIKGEVRVTATDDTQLTLREAFFVRDSVVGWHDTAGLTQRSAFPLHAVQSLESREAGAAAASATIGVMVVGLVVIGLVAASSTFGGMFR